VSFFTGGGSKDTRFIQDPWSRHGPACGPWLHDTTMDVVPDKNDIVNAFAAAHEDPDDGNTIFYFGLDTYSVNGDKTGDDLSKTGDDTNYTITVTNTSSADTPALTCTTTDDALGVNQVDVLASGDPALVINAFAPIPGGASDPYTNTADTSCSVGGFPLCTCPLLSADPGNLWRSGRQHRR